MCCHHDPQTDPKRLKVQSGVGDLPLGLKPPTRVSVFPVFRPLVWPFSEPGRAGSGLAGSDASAPVLRVAAHADLLCRLLECAIDYGFGIVATNKYSLAQE